MVINFIKGNPFELLFFLSYRFMQYYKENFNIDIADPNQPLLVHEKNMKGKSSKLQFLVLFSQQGKGFVEQ